MAHRSLAWPLAAVTVCLIAYASLHPFSGWEAPQHLQSKGWLLAVPQPRGVSRFDLLSNLLGYIPLGALLAAGVLRSGGSAWLAGLLALFLAAGLSYGLESLQHFLPRRVPSIIDWMLNAGGAAIGALVLLLVDKLGGLRRWQHWRERWLLRGRGTGLALLLLWPLGLLFPPPLPFGLGQVMRRAQDALALWLEDSAWDGRLDTNWTSGVSQLVPAIEVLGIAGGLLAPCLLGYALTRSGPRRFAVLAATILLGIAVTTLSTALNFGPEHALTWITPPVGPAVALAAAVGAALAWAPARASAALAVVVLAATLALINLAPPDPFYAASLQAWEQGRFIRFHGLSQWIGWLWPYAALVYLLARAASRGE